MRLACEIDEVSGAYARGGGGSGAVWRERGMSEAPIATLCAAVSTLDATLRVLAAAVAAQCDAAPHEAGAHGRSQWLAAGDRSCPGWC
jgi:hypothetical protein